MEVVTGALPSVIAKLGELLVGEYNLQKGVKGEILFLQAELKSMKAALEKVSSKPVDQIDIQDRIWAGDLRELSYDIEDSIDIFMVRGKGNDSVKLHGIKKFMERSVGLFRKAKIRHGIATEIKDMKSRVVEVHERRLRYNVNHGVDKPATSTVMDPRLFAQYTKIEELVGIDETRDELIKILMEENGVPSQQGKIVSIVGFGGLGKTTLAKAVLEKIKGQFDCYAFVSVSQTPHFKELFKGLMYDLDKNIKVDTLDERSLIKVVREFLKMKRYLIVIDDIWDLSDWKVIKCALPNNDVGYTVITTTRNADVVEKVGVSYKLEPLCLNSSRKLFYRRVFGNAHNNHVEDIEKCPDEELAEVSDKILEKCAGVPLAIITMASLLASKVRNKMDWYEVYHSIGTGLEHNLDVENMRKILSFSYYNMPSHLRTCLLYLSMFPEDYEVENKHLIWMWIAEGFIQCENQGKSLFELGESYINELINRSMIQPIYDYYERLRGCRVHDMVLDLICSLSSEANFLTISNGKNQMSPSSKIRRLSIQNVKEDNSMTLAYSSMQQVRSVIVLPSATSQIPILRSFQLLRVMNLKGCKFSQGYNLKKCLGSLFHLRYLGLEGTDIVELPEEIGNLQLLQTLDFRRSKIYCLPANVVQLKHLMRIDTNLSIRVPKGIGSLTRLEELPMLCFDGPNMDNIEELGQLTQLRVLGIELVEWNDKLVDCLQKLQKIQKFDIIAKHGERVNISGIDAWVAPRCIRTMNTVWGCWFSKLPAWMNPSHLRCLSYLTIAVREVQQRDLDILGSLHSLRYLRLLAHEDLGRFGEFVIGPGSFPCLICCYFRGFVRPIVFQQGAMPRLRTLYIQFFVREAIEVRSSNGVGLNFGLDLLPSVQEIVVWFNQEGTSKEEVEELKAALMHAIKLNPNQPRLRIRMRCR